MRRLMLILLVLVVGLTSLASASAIDKPPMQDMDKLSIIVFANKFILNDTQSLCILNDRLKAKFPDANIVIHGDNTAKPPEYRDFIEKIQTDPINEKGIRFMAKEHLISYGKTTGSKYVMVFSLKSREDSVDTWSYKTTSHMKMDAFVIDVNTGRYILHNVWDTEKMHTIRVGTKELMDKLQNKFDWNKKATVPTDESLTPDNEKKISVVVFMPGLINNELKSVALMRNTLKEKFKTPFVAIYDDNQQKDPSFLEFADKVRYDSLKHRSLVIRKEHLMNYGQDTNSSHVVAVKVTFVDLKNLRYRYNADIYALSVSSGDYVLNMLFDTKKPMEPDSAIELITEKIKNDLIWSEPF